MAFANANISDIVATTIESRTKKIADNVTSNNALLSRLERRGNVKTFSGGTKILQELSFAENANTGWYSGYDLLPVGVSDVLSAAEFEKPESISIRINCSDESEEGEDGEEILAPVEVIEEEIPDF